MSDTQIKFDARDLCLWVIDADRMMDGETPSPFTWAEIANRARALMKKIDEDIVE